MRRALEVLREHYGSGAAFLQVEQTSKVKGIASPPVNPDIAVNPEPLEPAVNPEPLPLEPAVNPEPLPLEPHVNPGNPLCEIVGISTKPAYIGNSEAEQGNKPDNSGAGASIINMLEVIESDFTKSLAEAQTDEDDAQEEYDKTTMQNKLDKGQKEKDVKRKSQQIVELEKALAQMSSELRSKHRELDAVLEYYHSRMRGAA